MSAISWGGSRLPSFVREAAGRTQHQVAGTFDWSPSKGIRIENGRIGISVTDAMASLS